MKERALIIAILLAHLVISGSATMLVPAVMTEDEGKLIPITAIVQPGSGKTYINIIPLVGVDTQLSERIAAELAARDAGMDYNSYDFFLSIESKGAKEVDGPSAGIAMYLLFLSAMDGRKLRTDATVTGAILSDGSVGKVGGVPQKVSAASDEGMMLILLPRERDTSERIILSALEDRYNITIVEIENVREAADIMFSADGSPPPQRTPPIFPRVDVSENRYECRDCRLDIFEEIARKIVEDARSDEETLLDKDPIILSYIENDINQSGEALEKGHLYTAANTAFLTRINIRLLNSTNISKEDLSSEIERVEECLSELKRPNLTMENMEWIFGGDVRRIWSEEKLREVKERDDGSMNIEELLLNYRDVLFAGSWCDVAGELYSAGVRIGGKKVDESLLRSMAHDKIEEGRKKEFSGDSAWHILTASRAYNKSLYGAGIYDVDYALSVYDAEMMIEKDGIERASEKMKMAKGRTLWSSLFLAHSRYYIGKGDTASGVRIGAMALRMENDTLAMREILESPPLLSEEERKEIEEVDSSLTTVIVLLCILLTVSAILNIVVFMRMRK